MLPSGACATRCIKVHSNVGADVEHVEEAIAMVAKLTPKQLERITIACYETALLCFSPPSMGYTSNEELQRILSPWKRI